MIIYVISLRRMAWDRRWASFFFLGKWTCHDRLGNACKAKRVRRPCCVSGEICRSRQRFYRRNHKWLSAWSKGCCSKGGDHIFQGSVWIADSGISGAPNRFRIAAYPRREAWWYYFDPMRLSGLWLFFPIQAMAPVPCQRSHRRRFQFEIIRTFSIAGRLQNDLEGHGSTALHPRAE